MKKKIALILIPLLFMSTIVLSMRLTSAQPQTLKVGVLVPYNLPHGHKHLGGAEGGAILAAIDINASGGIDIGGTPYFIELIFRDEHAYPLDEAAARTSTTELLQAGCKFIIGGFRTEVVDDIIGVIKGWNDVLPDDEKVIYFINGAATDELISTTVGTSYADYWWLFRVNPINSTMLFQNILGYLIGYLIPRKLAPMYGGNVNFGYFVEDLTWTQGIAWYLEHVGLGGNATFVYGAKTTPYTTNFVPYLDEAEAANVRLLVIAYTLPDSEYLIEQWRAGEYPFIIVGIDVMGQTAAWPYMTAGACEYEVEMDFTGTRSPITPQAVTFWDNFVGNFSLPAPNPPAWPVYTAWGAYNGFITLKKALEETDSLDPTVLVPYLETSETQVLNGKAKFTPWHDVYTNEYGPTWIQGYTRAMMAQWVFNASTLIKQVVCPIEQSYSRKTRIPTWIYGLSDWDINFDGKVDIKDVARVSKAFGTLPGQPYWDIEADINTDGKVDIKDVAAVSKNFGKSHTPWPLP